VYQHIWNLVEIFLSLSEILRPLLNHFLFSFSSEVDQRQIGCIALDSTSCVRSWFPVWRQSPEALMTKTHKNW